MLMLLLLLLLQLLQLLSGGFLLGCLARLGGAVLRRGRDAVGSRRLVFHILVGRGKVYKQWDVVLLTGPRTESPIW